MRIRSQVFTTYPSKRDSFWQVVILPTVSILRSVDDNDPYVAITIEWLFWSTSFLIMKS